MDRIFPIACVMLVLAATGPAAEIHIEGLPPGEAARLLEKIDPRLEFVRSRPPTPWRARDAAWMAERALAENGHRDVRVVERIEGDRIILAIDPGLRHHLAAVTVTGQEKKEAARLAALFSSPARARTGRLRGNGPWLDGDTDRSVALLVSDFHSRGYWTPNVQVMEEVVDPANGATRFLISAESGPLFTTAAAVFSGQLGLDADRLHSLAAPFAGRPADTTNLNNLRTAVEQAYSAAGYQFAHIAFFPRVGAGEMTPVFEIVARQRFRLGDIALHGLERTNETRVRKLYDSVGHEAFNSAAIDAIDQRLLATGAFRSIRRDLLMRDDGAVDLAIHLEEARARGLAFTAGAGSYDGLIAGATWYDRNADGRLGGYSLGGEWSNRGLFGIWRWTQPMFPGIDDTLSGRLQALSRDHEGYGTAQIGAEFGLARQFTPQTSLALFATAESVETSAAGLPESELGPTSYQDYGARAELRLNHLDNPAAPNRGWRAAARLGAGTISADGQYLEAGADAAWIHPIGSNDWLAARAAIDIIDSSGESLPIDKRLFIGGADSVRGFPERELGPLADGYPRGGEGSWSASIEHQHRLAGPLRSVLFFDAGSLSRDANPLGGDEVETSIGLGLRILLPIGPIRFEYGHNLSRDDGEPAGAFHFAIGLKF